MTCKKKIMGESISPFEISPMISYKLFTSEGLRSRLSYRPVECN